MWLKQAILYKKAALAEMLEAPMTRLASDCARVWPDPEALDKVLAQSISAIPHCHLLYALDTHGTQISSNVSPTGVETAWRGQQLSQRPYHTGSLPYRGSLLSSVYVSNISKKRCITALQAVSENDQLLGFVAADFGLDDIPLRDVNTDSESSVDTESTWTQYRGDPAIRGTVFMQKRMASILDTHIDEVIGTIDLLMREHGVFHVILHFSSSRAIFWVFDDPYRYRFHGIEDILDPEIWLAYPNQPYPTDAKVCPDKVRLVLEQYKALRLSDENIYLRSGSLNIMNGIVGLTFSCDGSHYMTVDDFLNKEHAFWV